MIAKQLKIWHLISSSLKDDIPVILLYVLESNGSSPGRQGFFMAVNQQGAMAGTIGGGVMEHKLLELAKSQMNNNKETDSIKLQVHDKEAATDQSGMICSGEQRILLYRVKHMDANTIGAIMNSLHHVENGYLRLSPGRLFFSMDEIPAFNYQFNYQDEDNWLYEEKTGYKNHLYIVGGGHCSLALSKIMITMDFYIHVLDDREYLHTMEQNNSVHDKLIIEDYHQIAPYIPSGQDHYVVIMTVGYRTDLMVVKALHHKHFKYVGLLGSRHKVGQMLEDLKSEGIDPEFLKSIHAPIGVPIKSETTEEIAISIAAEIIKAKNSHYV